MENIAKLVWTEKKERYILTAVVKKVQGWNEESISGFSSVRKETIVTEALENLCKIL